MSTNCEPLAFVNTSTKAIDQATREMAVDLTTPPSSPRSSRDSNTVGRLGDCNVEKDADCSVPPTSTAPTSTTPTSTAPTSTPQKHGHNVLPVKKLLKFYRQFIKSSNMDFLKHCGCPNKCVISYCTTRRPLESKDMNCESTESIGTSEDNSSSDANTEVKTGAVQAGAVLTSEDVDNLFEINEKNVKRLADIHGVTMSKKLLAEIKSQKAPDEHSAGPKEPTEQDDYVEHVIKSREEMKQHGFCFQACRNVLGYEPGFLYDPIARGTSTEPFQYTCRKKLLSPSAQQIDHINNETMASKMTRSPPKLERLSHDGVWETQEPPPNSAQIQDSDEKRDIHMQTQEGTRSPIAASVAGMFRCPHCPKIFQYASSLRTHRMFHSEDRPYPCDACEKRFKHESHVARHKTAVHWMVESRVKVPAEEKDITNWSCDHCGLRRFVKKKSGPKRKRTTNDFYPRNIVVFEKRLSVCDHCATFWRKKHKLPQLSSAPSSSSKPARRKRRNIKDPITKRRVKFFRTFGREHDLKFIKVCHCPHVCIVNYVLNPPQPGQKNEKDSGGKRARTEKRARAGKRRRSRGDTAFVTGVSVNWENLRELRKFHETAVAKKAKYGRSKVSSLQKENHDLPEDGDVEEIDAKLSDDKLDYKNYVLKMRENLKSLGFCSEATRFVLDHGVRFLYDKRVTEESCTAFQYAEQKDFKHSLKDLKKFSCCSQMCLSSVSRDWMGIQRASYAKGTHTQQQMILRSIIVNDFGMTFCKKSLMALLGCSVAAVTEALEPEISHPDELTEGVTRECTVTTAPNQTSTEVDQCHSRDCHTSTSLLSASPSSSSAQERENSIQIKVEKIIEQKKEAELKMPKKKRKRM